MLLSPKGSQKPRNYRGRLSYVNLEAACFTVLAYHFPDRNDLHLLASSQLLYSLLDLTFICFIDNDFGT